ncbi:MAG: hypothetical protein GF317_16670 [Candidatus Lokiarchaeota archaeon]|nr:hypothetical protein [Candidatus Lokiarchaeota archaeon]
MRKNIPSKNYDTIRISYPEEMNLKCPICGSRVTYKYQDNGKLVHRLKRDIYQIVNLYSCTNMKCKLSKKVFNIAPRFDYSRRYFGADVFRFVAEEFLIFEQKPDQIKFRLSKKYPLNISTSTIRRMCDDILKLKSYKIDENTFKIIKKQGHILLGLDGQDPGGNSPSIWCFMDLISNRILATRKFDSLDHKTLHRTIKSIQEMYGVEIVGWVSDKQGLITKCHDKFYPEIPHQYCQFHFLKNTWNHLKTLDSNIYLPIRKTINSLYIHNASKITKVYFEKIGKVSVKELFKPVDQDFQSMIRVRNKTFKELRGIWLYETLLKYVDNMFRIIKRLNPTYRYTKISKRMASKLKNILNKVEKYYRQVRVLNVFFQEIRYLLGTEDLSKEIKIMKLKKIYAHIFNIAKIMDPKLSLEECKSFLPSKKKSVVEIMGEWCRLWESYLPGLFQYYNFPLPTKTNNTIENGFSTEKQAILNRVAKGNVCDMIATRGEDYLRLKHSSDKELEADIVKEYSEEIARRLRSTLRRDIKKQTNAWHTKSKTYKKFDILTQNYYKDTSFPYKRYLCRTRLT